MKTFIAVLLISGNTWALDNLTLQANHDEMIAQLKESNAIARDQVAQPAPEPLNINVDAPSDPCSYALIKKGSGVETYTFPNGRKVNVYVRMCNGQPE